jgi:hypothetical protein
VIEEQQYALGYKEGYHARDAEIRTLRELLNEIWRYRNGGGALNTSWDRRVTEILPTNGFS